MTDTTQPHPEPQEATHKQPVSDEYNANLAAASLRQPSQEASSLPVVGYAIRESDQFMWTPPVSRPFAKAWRAVVYESDAQSQLTVIKAERDEWRDRATEAQAERDAAREERDEALERIKAMKGEVTVPDSMQEWARLDGHDYDAARSALRVALEGVKP